MNTLTFISPSTGFDAKEKKPVHLNQEKIFCLIK